MPAGDTGFRDGYMTLGGMNVELTIDELLQVAGSKRWTIWTISMIEGTARLQRSQPSDFKAP